MFTFTHKRFEELRVAVVEYLELQPPFDLCEAALLGRVIGHWKMNYREEPTEEWLRFVTSERDIPENVKVSLLGDFTVDAEELNYMQDFVGELSRSTDKYAVLQAYISAALHEELHQHA